MLTIRSDVAVVGAGPAGSAAALLLAREGFDVHLLDRARFPRDKVCGDYLSPGAVALLDSTYGLLPALRAAGAVWLPRAEVVAHDGRPFGAPLDAMSCARAITDALLVDAAAQARATLTTGFKVRTLDRDGKQVIGLTGVDADGHTVCYRTRLVIGADGSRSMIARALGVVRPLPRLHRIALRTYFGGSVDDSAVTMHLAADGMDACCGMGPASPESRLRNVNVVVPVSEASAIAGNRRSYFEHRLQRSFPRAAQALSGAQIRADVATIGCYGHAVRTAVADGAMLVGDAAAFVDPFTGEGVHHALLGARLAAQVACKALARGDTGASALREYDRLRQRELAPRYALCDIVRRVIQSPALLDKVASRFRSSRELAQAVFSATGDIIRPSDLLTLRNLGLALGVLADRPEYAN